MEDDKSHEAESTNNMETRRTGRVRKKPEYLVNNYLFEDNKDNKQADKDSKQDTKKPQVHEEEKKTTHIPTLKIPQKIPETVNREI